MKHRSRASKLSCAAVGATFALAGTVRAAACPPALLQPRLGTTGGVESVEARADGSTLSLRLVRFAPRDWAMRFVDMRELRQFKVRKGDYTSPSYSLAEIAAISPPDRVFSSGGLTESMYAPVPVGLLKINGKLLSRASTSSRILDGVLCVRADRSVRLLSELTPEGRRIPQGAAQAACVHALQAGPMLVEAAKPLVSAPTKLEVARVFAAIDRDGRFVLGYAPQATSYTLACLLSAPSLQIDAAIALQSDELGGIVFGRASGFPAATWGRSSGAIASAIELVARRK